MLTPKDIEELHLYRTEELCQILGVTKEKLGWLRRYGILKYRKFSRECSTTAEELAEFMEVTKGIDLSNKEKIQFFGMKLKSASSNQEQSA